jgi:Mg-chelatase subunit ChlD
MNDESRPPEISTELEARIVAFLLGEASDFERDELERLIEEREDVRDFKNQMQVVYGLLEHAAGDVPLEVGDPSAGKKTNGDELNTEWKLSEGKRETVLALFSDAEASGTNADSAVSKLDSCEASEAPLLVPTVLAHGDSGGHVRQGDVALAHALPMRLLRNPWLWSAAACALLIFGGMLRFGSWDDIAVSSVILADAQRVPESSRAFDMPSSALAVAEEEAMKVQGMRISEPQRSFEKSESMWFGEASVAEVGDIETDDIETDEIEIEGTVWNQMRGVEEIVELDPFAHSKRNSSRGASNGRPVSGNEPTAQSDLFIEGVSDADSDEVEKQNMEQSIRKRGEMEEDSRFKKGVFAEDRTQSGAKNEFGYQGFAGERDSQSAGRPRVAGERQFPSISTATATPKVSEKAQQSNRMRLLGQEEKQKELLAADGSVANGFVDGRFDSGKDVGGLGGGGGMGGGGGFAGNGLMDGEKFADKLQQQGQQQGGGIDAIVDSGLLGDVLDESDLAMTDPLGGQAREGNALPESRSTRRPVGQLAMPSQPSSSVSGPGPGIVPHVYYNSSGVQVLNNSEKRLSGLDANNARFQRKELKDDVIGGRQLVDQLARVESKKSKVGAVEDFSKQRNLAILGKTPVAHASVPTDFPEIDASANGFSTFSLHVSDVSFKLAQAALAKGEWPDAGRIRSEEFLNAFDYGDPMPTQSERVSCRIEQSIHPFLQQRNLMRVSMRTAAAGRSGSTPLRLTFLLDNSGSMERIDRQQTVRRAFAVLAQQLKPMDEVTLISFARQPRLLADRINGAKAQSLLQIIENLPSEGGTNLEAALQLAFEKAKEQYQPNAQNRIILLTDGAVNLGDASPDQLAEMVVKMRNAGVAFDAAGISADGLNDEVLEALTRQGDGRYYLLDSLEAVEDGFAKQIAGALRPAAKNVKIQIEFNPERVGKYKLLGFEKHRLKKEDFRNDKVDAAEMAAAEAGVALYQIQAKPDGFGDIGTVSVRFRDLESGQMVEEVWPIPYETSALRPDLASNSMKIATVASLFATKLKGDVLAGTVDLKELANLISSLPPQVRNSQRVKQLEAMIQQARQINGN